MKAIRSVSTDPNTTSTLVKIATLSFLFLSLIFLSKLFSDSYQHHLFAFSPSTTTAVNATSVSVGPPNAIISSSPPPIPITSPPQLPSRIVRPPPPPPPPPAVERTGIVDENGFMTDDFVVGEFDPAIIESVANASVHEGRETGDDDDQRKKIRVKLRKFGVCDESKRDYVPCLDNVEAISRLNSTDRGKKYERHCPEKGKGLNCLVPRPKGYKLKIPWPQSRDEVWFTNVPRTHLVEDKGGKNWISRKKDKFIFLGSETLLIHGTDEYLDQISKMVPDIEFGLHTRVGLDVGCGVASFGAFLVNRNVTTLSIAPKDAHENLIQFALERGVPAMVTVFATQRLFYPSQAFDLIHCSRCRINWTHNDGILLLEVNRILRSGGYFLWAPEPIYEHEDNMQEQWKEMEDFAERICWEIVKKEAYIAIWRKPLNNSCYLNRQPEVHPPLCEANDDPDDVWYVNLKKCITRLPENGYGANLTTWPARLHNPPDRLFTIKMDAYMSRKEIFRAESKYWNDIVSGYVGVFRWKKLNLRNVMDMRARYGGFAAALQDYGLDCWVMNVVPVSGSNTLPVIYDRGLIGVMHDWCEPFDTYPRTYDLLNAAGLFSVEQNRCNISTIMLEMDRILRPGGRVYIRDTLIIIEELKEIAAAMGWVTFLYDSDEGPHASWKLLLGEKRL